MAKQVYDVLIIGGSYAGMQAALTLARSLRKVLIVDSGKPCNRYVPNSHNLLLHDGEKPDDIAAASKEQVLFYPGVKFVDSCIVDIERTSEHFSSKDTNGDIHFSRKILLATGVKDILPDIEGFKECWGKTIVHCPYCHGYEVKGKKIGLLINNTISKEFLWLLYNWSADITLFTNGNDKPDAATGKFLQKNGIPVVNEKVIQVEHKAGQLCAVHTTGGTEYKLAALFTSVPFEQHEIVSVAGCNTDEKGHIETNIVGKTDIEGIYAAGDCLTPMRAISAAIASGYRAAIGLNNELIEEEWATL